MLDVDSVSPVIGLASTIRSFLDNPGAELLQVLERCDHSDLKVYKCKNVIKRNQAYVFQNDTYNNGFVEKNFKSTLIIDNNDVNPTLDEITQFTRRQDRCNTHIVNLSVIKRSGDQIEVFEGEQAGLCGVIEDMSTQEVFFWHRITRLSLQFRLRQDIAFFNDVGTGEVATQIQTDTHLVQQGISEKVALVISYLVSFITGFVLGCICSWRLALAVV
ncbi:hypothetical protein BYT27DRAFT_7217089 [Phlegmacium glaucopus]|nr:hypothetical protein BYT27DRAFT_7217089 [Phlegmacium glaucopus]